MLEFIEILWLLAGLRFIVSAEIQKKQLYRCMRRAEEIILAWDPSSSEPPDWQAAYESVDNGPTIAQIAFTPWWWTRKQVYGD